MTRPTEGNFRPTMLNLDPVELERFRESLPKFLSVSEVIRRYIHDENERIEKEKKGVAHQPRGALINNIQNDIYISDKQQTTLDIFAKEKEISKCFDELKARGDIPTIKNFTRNCQIGYDIGKSFFRKSKK